MAPVTDPPAARPQAGGRQRILDASYELFARQGVRAVGVDAVVERAGVAKSTLYRHFRSKDELAIAFLAEREQRWTKAWLVAELERRSGDPADRLVTLFDVLGEWFADEPFEGCAFIRALFEFEDRTASPHQATLRHLGTIRGYLAQQASDAGCPDPDEVARQWLVLVLGSTTAALAGDADAAPRARRMATALLAEHGLLAG